MKYIVCIFMFYSTIGYTQEIFGEYELISQYSISYLNIKEDGTYYIKNTGDQVRFLDDSTGRFETISDTGTGKWILENDTLYLYSYVQLKDLFFLKEVTEEVLFEDTCNIYVYLFFNNKKPVFDNYISVSSNRVMCKPYFFYDSIQKDNQRISERTWQDGKATFKLKDIDTIWIYEDVNNFWKQKSFYIPKSNQTNVFKFYLSITENHYHGIYSNGDYRFTICNRDLKFFLSEYLMKNFNSKDVNLIYKRKE